MNLRMDSEDYSILQSSQIPITEIVKALQQGISPTHDENWFRWKHVDSPFGASEGWVAVDDQGVVGIRLFMRWNLKFKDRRIFALRPVDTITLPRARRKGIFRNLTEYSLSVIKKELTADLIFNTPNAYSLPGYRSLGWQILPKISHSFHPILLGHKASIDETDRAFDSFDFWPNDLAQIVTERNAGIMRWRYSKRSGIEYRAASLREANWPNAIVYRTVIRRGFRLLIICELIGNTSETKVLVRSVAKENHAIAVVMSSGSGAFSTFNAPAIRHGGSMLAVLPVQNLSVDPVMITNWALTLGDLEKVI